MEKSMSKAKSGDTVRVHYTGKLEDGTQFDSSAGKDPLEFSIGAGEVLPAFDSAVEGMAIGDSKSVNIEAAEAYGRRHEQLIQDVPREHLPDDMQPAVGMQLQAQGQDGQPIKLVVTEVKKETITVDGNHPLAGKDLDFDIKLVDIKYAEFL
jgi:peptidylprolyl isomerase